MKYLLLFSLLLISCGGSTFVDTSKLPDNYQCNYMKDVCKEAREFESRYSRMSKEEQEEFKTVLQTYRNQCNDALEECQKSNK
ncbi:MAG: hypothetical protein GX089_13520 [Fibrobacter sp.]|jgi:hypothetical protein|nr:hypothetical protein [Fibrobacter sp.]